MDGDYHRDDMRFNETKADVVFKRTRLLPLKQVEDYRNAISYLQGRTGVDAERIGVWGSSFAGGNSIVVAAMDARVKAISIQVPAVGSKTAPAPPYKLQGKPLEDAINRAYLPGSGVRNRLFVPPQSRLENTAGPSPNTIR